MAYFVGWIANTLPLPGGVGGVEGGLIGSFSAFGVNVQTAVLAVLAYRAFSFWLPTIPGAIAYLQLRRTVHRWRQEPLSASAGGEPGWICRTIWRQIRAPYTKRVMSDQPTRTS